MSRIIRPPQATRASNASAHLEALVSQIPIPAIIVDREDLTIHHNGHAQATLEATPEQLAARPVWDFLEACHALETALANTREGAAPGATVTVASRRRGRRLQATLIALREARETTLVLLQAVPMSGERVETHVEPDERKLAALGTLVASVMHELKTPLTYVRNNLEIARKGLERLATSSPEAREDARRLEKVNADAIEGIERASGILAELRPLSQNRRHHREPVDLAEIAVAAARQFRVANPGDVRVALDLQATHEVMVDKDQVLAALLNLMRNAAQAMRGGPGVVTIEVRNETRRPPRIRVIDHGPGIASEDVARLFEPFHTTKPEGTGLGLFIARQAILAHGGTLRYEPTPGGGATFVIEFAPG